MCRTSRFGSALSRWCSSLGNMRRIRRAAGKPRRTGALFCRSALSGRGRRLAALCRSASWLPALRHGDVILLSRRHAAVRTTFIDLLGRNSGETGGRCCVRSAAMV